MCMAVEWGRRYAGRKLVPLIFFLCLTVFSTWPLLGKIQTHLPLGMENAATAPLFNLWCVWWNSDRAAAGYSSYWNAPIFYPSQKSFAFSEPMPLSVLAGPILWITDNRILAYNCLLLSFLWLNGITGFLLLRRLSYGYIMALWGGAMLEMLPLVHSFLGVLQLVPIFGILSTLLSMDRLRRTSAITDGILTGAAFTVTYLLCAYYGAFLAILLLGCGGFLFWRKALNPKLYLSLIFGMLLCLLLCLPVIRTQQQVFSTHQRELPLSYLAQLSADINSYRVPPWPGMFESNITDAIDGEVTFKLAPGKVRLVLMLLGIGWGLSRRSRRDWTLFCSALMVTSFLLSFGPRLCMPGFCPYPLLIDWVPWFVQIRNVFRFAVFVHIAVTLLAIQGVLAGFVLIRRYLPQVGRRRYAAGVLAGIAFLALIEIWPATQPLYAVPAVEKNLGWTEYLRTRTPSDSIVVCVPFPFKPDAASYQQETQWLYWGSFHHRRMVNGYSGLFPQSFIDLKWPMAEFPNKSIITQLGKLGVDYCVVKGDSFYGEEMRRYVRFDPRVETVYRDNKARIEIYRLSMN